MAHLPEVSTKDLVIWDDQRSMCCGYLNKKASKSSAFSKGKWQKRWFFINIDLDSKENYALSYAHGADEKAKQNFPLINASVKLAGGTNFVVSLVDDTVLTLSADSTDLVKKWVDTIENVVRVANHRERAIQANDDAHHGDDGDDRHGKAFKATKSALLLKGDSSQSRGHDYDGKLGAHSTDRRKRPAALGSVSDDGGDTDHTRGGSPMKSPSARTLMSHHPALRLDVDINTIPPSSTSRHQFLELFMEDISAALEIIPGLLEVISVQPAPGMDWLTMVQFDVLASAIPVDDMSNPEYAEEVAVEQEEIRTKLLWTLSELVADTSSSLYQGFVTCKLDPSFSMNLRGVGDEAEELVPFSADPEVMEVMDRYKNCYVPTNELDITHFTIQLHFEDIVRSVRIPNPLVLKKRCCALWPFEVKQALGFIGTMQEMWIEPVALVPRDLPKQLSQPIPFQPSVRFDGLKLINASHLTADQAYDVQCEDRRDEALSALSEEEMEAIKATFQQCDGDGDGGISHAEMIEIVRDRTHARRTVIEERFEAYVSEPTVTPEEVEAAEASKAQYLQSLQEAQGKLLKMFEAADLNGDGVISFTEFIMAEAWWLRCTINPEKAHLF